MIRSEHKPTLTKIARLALNLRDVNGAVTLGEDADAARRVVRGIDAVRAHATEQFTGAYRAFCATFNGGALLTAAQTAFVQSEMALITEQRIARWSR